MSKRFSFASFSANLSMAADALRMWTARQWWFAALTAVAFGVIVGLATVLIPNSVFSRDIDTVWWNYPVWILTAVGVGMLTATYVNPKKPVKAKDLEPAQPAELKTLTETSEASETSDNDVTAANFERQEREADRSARLGMVGGILTWFAVGCPVCNKIALIALGYSGAITWFAPFQPVLALAALVLTGWALMSRLKGQIVCSVKLPKPKPALAK